MSSYALTNTNFWLGHGRQSDFGLLQDGVSEADELQTAAFIASGDYFEMLASELDHFMFLLPPDSSERYQLDRIIKTLLDVQDKYRIVPKAP